MDGEGIVEENDVTEVAGAAELAQFGEYIFLAATAAVFGGAFVELIKHARAAVGAGEGASTLRRELDNARGLVEDVAGSEGKAVERFDRFAEDRAESAADPDVGESMGAAAGGEGVDEVEKRFFAFAEAGVVEAW